MKVIFDIALDNILDDLVSTMSGWTCHLYQNDWTPTRDDDAGDYTEATFSGYASQTLTGWSAASVTAHVATSEADQLTFEHNGGATSNQIYGYFVKDDGGNIVAAERYADGPISMTNNGDQFRVTVKETLQSLGT